MSHPTSGDGPPPGGDLPPPEGADSPYPPVHRPGEYGPRPPGYGPPHYGSPAHGMQDAPGYPAPGYGSGYGPRGYPDPGYPNPGYGARGYGTPAGPRPIPRPLPPVPARPGSGIGGVFVVLAIVAVVLVGTIGLGRGMSALGLATNSSQQSAYPAEPVRALPVSGPLTSDDAAALERLVGPGLVDVTAQLTSQHAVGAGTGIVLSSDGEILTNNHVIRGASSVKVTSIGNGRSYPATVIGYDRVHDIAVLQARGASGLRPAKLGDSDTVQVGDQIAAIGNAGGVGGRPSVATGPVTDLDRTIRTSDELTGNVERLTGLIEARANIQPGDSGGPMVNTDGEVIGVDVAASVDSRSQTPNGTGFAIPINDAMSVARQIRGGSATEAVHIGETGLLGVTVPRAADDRVAAAEFGTSSFRAAGSPRGALVTDVALNTPALGAGIRQGDVITSVDGAVVDSSVKLTTLIGMHRPGDRVAVTWVEPSGQQQSAIVALISGPPS